MANMPLRNSPESGHSLVRYGLNSSRWIPTARWNWRVGGPFTAKTNFARCCIQRESVRTGSHGASAISRQRSSSSFEMLQRFPLFPRPLHVLVISGSPRRFTCPSSTVLEQAPDCAPTGVNQSTSGRQISNGRSLNGLARRTKARTSRSPDAVAVANSDRPGKRELRPSGSLGSLAGRIRRNIGFGCDLGDHEVVIDEVMSLKKR